MPTRDAREAMTRANPYRRCLRFHTYKTATNNPPEWFKWHWNEYREVLTPEGVGVRLGGGLQIGRRMFSVRWKERVRRVA